MPARSARFRVWTNLTHMTLAKLGQACVNRMLNSRADICGKIIRVCDFQRMVEVRQKGLDRGCEILVVRWGRASGHAYVPYQVVTHRRNSNSGLSSAKPDGLQQLWDRANSPRLLMTPCERQNGARPPRSSDPAQGRTPSTRDAPWPGSACWRRV